MTPSILTPLNAAQAQLTGPDASHSTSMAGASQDDGMSFSELVAQENAQQHGESGPGQESTSAADESARASRDRSDEAANEAVSDEHQSASYANPLSPQGGQSLPPVAASDGLLETELAGPASGGNTNPPTAPGGDARNAPMQAPANPTAPVLTDVATSSSNGPSVANTLAASTSAITGSSTALAGGATRGASSSLQREQSIGEAARGRAFEGSSALAAANRLAGEGFAAWGAREPALQGELASIGGTRSSLGTFNSLSGSELLNGNAAMASQASSAGALPSSPVPPSGAIPGTLAPNALFTLDAAGTASSNPGTFELTQPLGSQAWHQELGGRLQWLTDARIGRAELRMNPAELGPLEITLTVRGEEVSATFQAQHAATRDAVEQALPRLREMMAESGLQLADTSVGQQGGEQAAQHEQGSGNGSSNTAHGQRAEDPGVGSLTSALTLEASLGRIGSNQLDLYA